MFAGVASWLARVGRSLRHFLITPWVVWVHLSALVGLVAWPLHSPSELHFRCSAAGLQAMGVLILAFGIYSTRKQFGRPSLWTRLAKHWLDRPLIWRKPRAIHASVAVELGSATLTGHGATVRVLNGLEDRVAALEEDYKSLKGTVREGLRRAAEGLESAKQELSSATAGARAEAESVKGLLGRFATGGLDLSLFSVFYLMFGILYGTFPSELACWLE